MRNEQSLIHEQVQGNRLSGQLSRLALLAGLGGGCSSMFDLAARRPSPAPRPTSSRSSPARRSPPRRRPRCRRATFPRPPAPRPRRPMRCAGDPAAGALHAAKALRRQRHADADRAGRRRIPADGSRTRSAAPATTGAPPTTLGAQASRIGGSGRHAYRPARRYDVEHFAAATACRSSR